jgi:orotidine-5'-phosphate decarboxylase
MAIEILHEKIRKLKNPSMIDFRVSSQCVPTHLVEEEGEYPKAYFRFCRELLSALKGIVPAVRFGFDDFALLCPEGLTYLSQILKEAGKLGFYVLLDGPQILSPWSADRASEVIFGGDAYPCDGLLVCPYIGTDALKPFMPYCKEGKDLFVVLRSPNKSAAELQDLLTGTRLMHHAAADFVNRMGETLVGKSGYSRLGAVVSAGAPNSVKNIRNAYKNLFLMVDGVDYPSGNYKNCSHGFDCLGYGAVVCAGPSVTAAWMEAESDGRDYVQQALDAAERMKKNICRYITIL